MTPDISNSQEDQKPGRGIKSSRYLEIARKEFFTQRKLLFLTFLLSHTICKQLHFFEVICYKFVNGHIFANSRSIRHRNYTPNVSPYFIDYGKANPCGKDAIDLTWIARCRFDFQNWWNMDEFSTQFFWGRFDVDSTWLLN